jgi:hypothetical protein
MNEEKLTFHNHPLKEEIIKRWNNNESNQSISIWLKTEHPETPMSVATLCKHYKRYKFNQRQQQSIDGETLLKKRKKKNQLPIEDLLWETIQQCRKMKKDPGISVKDWQYLDQQMQCAVEKLLRLQELGGDERDISVILSEIFRKIGSGEEVELEEIVGKELSDEEKNAVVKEVDNENKPTEEQNTEASGASV